MAEILYVDGDTQESTTWRASMARCWRWRIQTDGALGIHARGHWL